MSKKLLSIFVLILTFAFTTQALASFTFSSSAITGSGVTSVNTGSLFLSGSTSGVVTIAPAAVAGTYTLTLPTTDGTASQYLQTDGAGVLTWATVVSGATTDATRESVYIGAGGDPTNPIPTGGTGAIRIGAYTGANLTTGSDNILLGSYAGNEIITGGSNIAIGQSALYDGTTNSDVIAIGYQAGSVADADGSFGSVYIGTTAGQYAANGTNTGDYNIMVGYRAGYTLNTNNTTLVGSNTMNLVYNTANGNNTALGYSAGNKGGGAENWNGSYNTFLGAGTGIQKGVVGPTTTDNVTLVGYGAYVDYLSPNTVVLGNASVTNVLAGSTALAKIKAGSVQLTTGTRPTCDATTRGTTWYVAGGAGVTDTIEICGKNAANAYNWVALATFP